MKIKVSEAKDRALDWLVAKAEGARGIRLHTYRSIDPLPPVWVVDWARGWVELSSLAYSTDWEQGGPIIEREWLDVTPWPNETDGELRWQCEQYDNIDCVYFGPTCLIAAMRCFVASRLGDEVDVPDELIS